MKGVGLLDKKGRKRIVSPEIPIPVNYSYEGHIYTSPASIQVWYVLIPTFFAFQTSGKERLKGATLAPKCPNCAAGRYKSCLTLSQNV